MNYWQHFSDYVMAILVSSYILISYAPWYCGRLFILILGIDVLVSYLVICQFMIANLWNHAPRNFLREISLTLPSVLSVIRHLVLYCKYEYICVQHKWYDMRTATKLLESLALNMCLKGHFAATWSNLFVTCIFSGSVMASSYPNWHFSGKALF
jgi:hypothetical protein